MSFQDPTPSTNVVARSARGSILDCPCCDRYEIRFGNAVFELHAFEFEDLADALLALGESPIDPGEARPHLLHPVQDAPIAFAFSEAERVEFAALVQDAMRQMPTPSEPAYLLN